MACNAHVTHKFHYMSVSCNGLCYMHVIDLVCVGFHGVSAFAEMAFRVPVRDRTVNALERRSASLKIESQLSIDKELASIKRMTYSGRRLMTPRARAPAAHLGIYLRSKVLRSACEFSANEMGAWPISPAHALASP